MIISVINPDSVLVPFVALLSILFGVNLEFRFFSSRKQSSLYEIYAIVLVISWSICPVFYQSTWGKKKSRCGAGLIGRSKNENEYGHLFSSNALREVVTILGSHLNHVHSGFNLGKINFLVIDSCSFYNQVAQ